MSTKAKEHYDRDGYHIYTGLVPTSLIDHFVAQYEATIVPSRQYFFRQSGRFEKNRLTTNRSVKNSFMNLHCYDHPMPAGERWKDFSELAREIFCHPAVKKAVEEVTGYPEHVLVQSMLFDMNMETEPHQDCYYLDSLAVGHLLGGWFALEDIHEDAGLFYVLPGSHASIIDVSPDEARVNQLYIQKMEAYMQNQWKKVHAPSLKKGDLLLWNSKTVHGSLPTRNRRHTRRSLTAHYLPSGMRFGACFGREPVAMELETENGMAYRVMGIASYVHPPLFQRAKQWLYRKTRSFDANPFLYKLLHPKKPV